MRHAPTRSHVLGVCVGGGEKGWGGGGGGVTPPDDRHAWCSVTEHNHSQVMLPAPRQLRNLLTTHSAILTAYRHPSPCC